MLRRYLLSFLSVVLLGVGTVLVQAPNSSAQRQDDAIDLASLILATPSGGTLTLEAGLYAGDVDIDRPITIKGVPGTVIDGFGSGTVIRINSSDVVLDSLEIRGSGATIANADAAVYAKQAPRTVVQDCVIDDALFGVYLLEAPDSMVLRNDIRSKDVAVPKRGDTIHVFQSPGTLIEGNYARSGRDMIAFFSSDTRVINNRVEDSRYGLHIMYSDNVDVQGNIMFRNSTAIYVMYSRDSEIKNNVLSYSDGPSGYGMATKEADIPLVTGNRFVGNRVGVFMDTTPFNAGVKVLFDQNVFAYNISGVMFQPSIHDTQFTRNAFIDNQEQISITSGGVLKGNDWTIDGVGNYWSDYAGYDRDGDGLGDIPYRAESLYDSMTDRHPQLQFFAETPAAQALDAAARAFPSLRPDPKAVDDAPLVNAPVFPRIEGMPEGASRSVLAYASILLLAVAGGLVWRGTRSIARFSV